MLVAPLVAYNNTCEDARACRLLFKHLHSSAMVEMEGVLCYPAIVGTSIAQGCRIVLRATSITVRQLHLVFLLCQNIVVHSLLFWYTPSGRAPTGSFDVLLANRTTPYSTMLTRITVLSWTHRCCTECIPFCFLQHVNVRFPKPPRG